MPWNHASKNSIIDCSSCTCFGKLCWFLKISIRCPIFLVKWQCANCNYLVALFSAQHNNYRTRAIINRGFYMYYPIFEDYFFVFKEVFLRMVFCYQNCSDLLWEKIVQVTEKNFWHSLFICKISSSKPFFTPFSWLHWSIFGSTQVHLPKSTH